MKIKKVYKLIATVVSLASVLIAFGTALKQAKKAIDEYHDDIG